MMDSEIFALIEKVGVPGIMCLVLLYQNHKQNSNFVKAVNKMTLAIKSLKQAIEKGGSADEEIEET